MLINSDMQLDDQACFIKGQIKKYRRINRNSEARMS